jgi:long-chain acyl-CoA synthetase
VNVGYHLTQAAVRWPHKIGLHFEGRDWTFSAFNRLANKTAHAFAARSIGPGDRVAFLTWNLPEQVACFYGLLKLGAVAVPINYRLAANEIKYIIDDCGARILVFDDNLRAPVEIIKNDLPSVELLVCVGGTPAGAEIGFEDFVDRAWDGEPTLTGGNADAAFIMYTSGTTGKPKGVVRSHQAEIAGGSMQALELNYRHDDVIIHNKPLFHIAQLQCQLLPFVMLGGTGVLTRGFDVHETLSLVEQQRITCLHGVPTQMVMMMQADLSKYDLTSLRMGFYGGQTLNNQTLSQCMPLFPESFHNVYGATEVLAVSGVDYLRHPTRLGSVGHALANTELRVLPEGSINPAEGLGAGEVGQVIVRGPTLLTEYYNMPERTATSVRDGWYFTGDAGFLDEDGFLTVLGRMDYTIKSGGENVHPMEIENLLFKHPGIADAAVIGLPSRKWGEAVCAAVVRKDPRLTAEALESFCLASDDLANFKRPRHYFFLDRIPSNSTGKVERAKLKAELMTLLENPLP